jgi:acetylornithine deacetylase/succinyl-diaminopimelate desuccinylase-like protein
MVPARDLVLALTTGEESDIENGVIWLLERQRTLVDAEYVLNLDAGGADLRNGKVEAFGIEAAEKVYMDLDMIARGAGGHSSIPPVQTPIDHLARALEKVGQYNFPIAVNAVMRSYLEKRAPLAGGDVGAAMAVLARNPSDAAAAATLTKDRRMNSLLRTTCVATILRGGTAPNAIPQEVAANVNCRVLPGTPQADVLAALRSAVADSTIDFVVTNPMHPSGPSIPTPAVTAMIERVLSAEHPGIPVIPYMETGATDGLWFRNAGIPVFAVSGFFVEDADGQRAHGKDERIPVRAFGELVRYTVRLLAEVAASK